jgi:hypothetical protein
MIQVDLPDTVLCIANNENGTSWTIDQKVLMWFSIS